MRGTMWTKSIVPSRADDTSTVRPRCHAKKPSAATEPHKMTSMIRALMGSLRVHPDINKTSECACKDRQRHRDQDAPEREIGPQDGQFPGDRAAVPDQCPA